VKLSTSDERDSDTTIKVVSTGEVFGVFDIFLEGRRTSASAIEDLTVRYLAKEGMLELMLTIPQFAVNMMQAANATTISLIDRISSYTGSWALRRLSLALVNLAEEGDMVPDGVRLRPGVTHEFLASLIGSARETVTLGLKKLKETGAVHQVGRTITVVPDKLKEIANSQKTEA
jgi:CRP-like cAMP-binding protein